MARKSKEPLYDKLWKRTQRDTVEERDLGYGRVLDYSKGRKVELFWKQTPEMEQDQMVRIKISGRGLENSIELVLDNEQLLKYLRWV